MLLTHPTSTFTIDLGQKAVNTWFIMDINVVSEWNSSEGKFTPDSIYTYPSLVVRLCAFFSLVVVLMGDILNLFAIYFKSLTLIIFWQLIFLLYFILAYSTLIASYISTIQTILAFEVSCYTHFKIMSTSYNK